MRVILSMTTAVLGAVLWPVSGLAAEPKTGTEFRDCPECPEMVVLPAGSFIIGSPANEDGRFEEEGPQRRVTIQQIAMGNLT